MTDAFNEILTGFDDILYTWLLIYMLAGAGIYFTVRSGFVQIQLLIEAFNCMFEKKPGDKGMSSFQALMIATASRVGTGNMAGMGSAPNASASAIAFRALRTTRKRRQKGRTPYFANPI